MMFFGCNISNVNPLNAVPLNAVPLNAISLKCVWINNQECKIRPEIININSNESLFYSYSNVKVFNLMKRTIERRHIKWHETCKCKCRLEASVCNNKQR